MNGGAEKIDTSYEKLRTEIQKKLSTSKSKEEYISNCKKLLQEIVNMPNSDKFLGTYGESKTIFYDFTPDLIKEALNQKSLQTTMGLTLQQVGQGTIKNFRTKPEQASKAFGTLEAGIRKQEEVKEGPTQGEE